MEKKEENVEFEMDKVLTKEDKAKLSVYDKELEDKISAFVMKTLFEKVLEEEVSQDYLRGFRHALSLRRSMFRDYFSLSAKGA